MRSIKSAIWLSALIASFAVVGASSAAPLCPLYQGAKPILRRVMVRIRDRDRDSVRIEHVRDVWFKRLPGQPTDTLCVSISGSQTSPPYFIEVLHSGSNTKIVDANGNIDFAAAQFKLPVALSFNLSDALIKPVMVYDFDKDWKKDLCVVKQSPIGPPLKCVNNFPSGWGNPTVEAWSGAPPMDLLSLLAPNTPNQQFEYTLTLWDREGKSHILDPKIVNQ